MSPQGVQQGLVCFLFHLDRVAWCFLLKITDLSLLARSTCSAAIARSERREDVDVLRLAGTKPSHLVAKSRHWTQNSVKWVQYPHCTPMSWVSKKKTRGNCLSLEQLAFYTYYSFLERKKLLEEGSLYKDFVFLCPNLSHKLRTFIHSLCSTLSLIVFTAESHSGISPFPFLKKLVHLQSRTLRFDSIYSLLHRQKIMYWSGSCTYTSTTNVCNLFRNRRLYFLN